MESARHRVTDQRSSIRGSRKVHSFLWLRNRTVKKRSAQTFLCLKIVFFVLLVKYYVSCSEHRDEVVGHRAIFRTNNESQ